MRAAWDAWVLLLDRKEPATALALVRITCAIVLLVDHLLVWRVGLVQPLWSPPPDGFAIGAPWIGGFDGYAIWTAATLCLVAIVLGVATRVACLAFALISAQQATLAPDGESAIDQLLRIVFVILAMSRCNARWSIDGLVWRRLGRPLPAEVPAWPRYLLALQLLWVYTSAAMNKSGAGWGPQGGFVALGNALMDPVNGRLSPELIATLYPLTRIATALTITFEATAPLYLVWLYYAERGRRWARHLRFAWLGLGVAFELGIAIGLKLGAFPFGMLALFPVLLVPRELQRLNTPAPPKRASSPS